MPHKIILGVNSLAICFGKKNLLPKVGPGIHSKSRAEFSLSSGWMISLEIIPTLVWNCFKGWDFVALVSCILLERVLGKPLLIPFFLLLKTFLLNFYLKLMLFFFFLQWQLHRALWVIFIINGIGSGERSVSVEEAGRGKGTLGTCTWQMSLMLWRVGLMGMKSRFSVSQLVV